MVRVNWHLVQIVVLESRGQHEKTYQVSNVGWKLPLYYLWLVLLPHQVYEYLDSVLLVDSNVSLALEEFNEILCVVSIKNPIKVKSLHCNSSKVILRLELLHVKLKVVVFFLVSNNLRSPRSTSTETANDPTEASGAAICFWLVIFVDLLGDHFFVHERCITCKHNLVDVRPVNDEWNLKQWWVELRFIKVIESLDRYHVLEITKHHLWAANVLEVSEHGHHHLKCGWLLLHNCYFKCTVSLEVIKTENKQRHLMKWKILELLSLLSLHVLLENELHYALHLHVASEKVEQRLPLELEPEKWKDTVKVLKCTSWIITFDNIINVLHVF